MGDVRRALLRPSRATGGLRPAARSGVDAALIVARALALAAAIVLLCPSAASADTVPVAEYRARLDQAQTALLRARALPASARGALVNDARALLRRTEAVAVGDTTVAIDDAALADVLDERDATLDAAIARLGARIALVERVGRPPVDPAAADARLREVLRQADTSTEVGILELLGIIVARFLSGLRGPAIDPTILWPAVGTLGIAIILFVLATLGRALPERVRREVLMSGLAAEGRPDPAAHLRAADAALAAGRPRDALHALFLYVVAALAAREAIRYDPALTDQELLVRAAAIPHADALRDLVAMYERSWFGLRDPSADEARRARDLALRVAP